MFWYGFDARKRRPLSKKEPLPSLTGRLIMESLRKYLAMTITVLGDSPAGDEAQPPPARTLDQEPTPPGDVQASSPPSTGTAFVSTEQLDAIRSLQQPDSPDLLSELIEAYFTSSDQLMDSLRRAVRTADAQTVMRSAHSLKSSSANLGALSLAEYCKEMETLGRTNTLADASAVLVKIDAEYAGVCRTLSSMRQAAPSGH
jgi:two-component system, sensor histidine kinase and response regulator